ncbi:hypothetical protein GCM10027589_49850 [Actinocorallia lasiicapitis]
MSSPGYRVRRASASDLDAVRTVLSENRPVRPPRPEPPREPSTEEIATWERMAATPGLTVYLAESGGEPVGTASMTLLPHLTYGCRPSALIEAVVVTYAHRRLGVATRLLSRALDDARAASCFKIQLLSHKRHADDGAHGLYRSLGFAPEAEGFRLYLDR